MASQDVSPVSQSAPSISQQLMQLSSGYMPAAALYTVSKLNIADLLVSGPRPVAELAKAAGVNEDGLYRVMRLLATLGIFSEVGLRYFTLTPAAELLRSDAADSARDLVIWISNPFHLRVFADMMHSVETGAPAVEKTTGMPCFEYFMRDHEVSDEFNAAMTNISEKFAPAVLDAYDFSDIGTLVDVGGGHGFLLSSILRKYTGMQGVLFDIERVIEGARAKLQQDGLAHRCRAVGGDFFAELPAGGDAYMMQHIIHDWDYERAIKILSNVRRALQHKPHGKLLVLEDVIMPGNEPGLVKGLDLEMLLLPGGRERSEQEFRQLFAAAGFKLNRVIATRAPIRVLEGVIDRAGK